MGILTQEELEKSLFDAINKCYQNGRRLLVVDFFKFIMQYFDNNWQNYVSFLNQLAQNGYIKFEGSRETSIIMFGPKGMEWRQRLANAFPDQPQQIANQTFDILSANKIQPLDRNISNFNQDDTEQLKDHIKSITISKLDPDPLAENLEYDVNNIEDYAEDDQELLVTESFRYNIDSYTNAIPVERLVDDFLSERIYLPDFQRPYVWNRKDTQSARHKPSLFIDSILQGLPIPPISIYRNAKEMDSGILIDGQQRLKTLAWYIRGTLDGQKNFFALKGEGINSAWLGKDFGSLDETFKDVLLRAYIPVTYIRQLSEDKPPLPEGSSLYVLFDRLNSGGAQLKPHEKRSVLAIYNPSQATLTKFLKFAYDLPQWDEILPIQNIEFDRWKLTTVRELIFRLYAFCLYREKYNGNLAIFLDDFMLNYDLNKVKANMLKEATKKLLNNLILIKPHVGKLFCPYDRFNIAFYEAFCSILLGIYLNGNEIPLSSLKNAYNQIVEGYLYLGKSPGSKQSGAAKKVVEKRFNDISNILISLTR